MSTIPCDFCPHPVDRAQMEEIEISHYVPDSSGDDLAYARTYFFGHPDCVRKFYRGLVEHKLDLFKHMPMRPAMLLPQKLPNLVFITKVNWVISSSAETPNPNPLAANKPLPTNGIGIFLNYPVTI